jgi:putative RecB family exonuclease
MNHDLTIPTYSPTQLETFRQCPLKFKFRYIDHIETGVEGVEAFLGNRVHDALQKLYDDLREEKFHDLNDLIDFYESRWESKWHDSIRIVKPDRTEDDYFDHGVKCIRNYYHENEPFNQSQTIWLEKWIEFDLVRRGRRRFRGRVDRVSSRPDGTYEIHDYKTTQWVPSLRDLADGVHKDGVQLSLYQLAVSSELPEARSIELVWHYLSRGITYRLRRNEHDLVQILQDTNQLVDHIESERQFPAKKQQLCDWCEFREICPAWSR